MGSPGFVTGGADGPFGLQVEGDSLGVFAQYPGATKKYIQNVGPRDAEYRETMARMFVQMTAKERTLFLQSIPPETRPVAKVLCGVATGASGGTGFIDFLLTQVNEAFSEKYQVVETLSDNFVVYLFGQAAPMFSYSGVLLNTYQDDQRVWMTRLYRDILRGTQLARRRKLLRLRYDSVIVSGVMLNLNMQIIADQEDRIPFTFNFIPTQYVIYTEAIGAPTKLKTPFTPAGGFAIETAATPETTRLRVAGRAAAPAQATRKRQNQKDNNQLSIKPPRTGDKAAPTVDKAEALRQKLFSGAQRLEEIRKKNAEVLKNLRAGTSLTANLSGIGSGFQSIYQSAASAATAGTGVEDVL